MRRGLYALIGGGFVIGCLFVVVVAVDPWLRLAAHNSMVRLLGKIAPPKVVLVGDSLIAEGGIWDFDLRQLPLRTLNEGVSGYTSDQIVKVALRALRRKPKVIIVLMGTNDFLSVDASDVDRVHIRLRENTEKIWREACVAGVSVLQISIPPVRQSESNRRIAAFNQWLREFDQGRAHVVDLSDVEAPNGGLAPQLTSDGVHFNRAGYKLLADRLASALRNARSPCE